MLNCLFVALGGAVGSVLRYLVGLIPVSEKCLFPLKTFSINVAGCLLICLIVALAAKSPLLNPRFVLFLKVGLCGGFTTYSTFALESSDLLKSAHWGIAAAYVAVSIVMGVGEVFLGEWAGEK